MTCTECGYNLPHHAMDCSQDLKVWRCTEHAPANATQVGFDDGKARCDTCGTYGGNVKPYRI